MGPRRRVLAVPAAQAMRVQSGFAAFVRLSRLKFLYGGFAGAALGTAVARYENGRIAWAAYALAQLTITAAHLMTQYANDYFDRESDARTIRTPYSGGSGALVDGTLAPVVALRAALVCLCASIGGVVALVAHAHAVAAMIAVAIVALAWAYSAPPLRLLARGLGELDTALVVAVLVPVCAYAAQTGTVDARMLASTFAGASAMFVMMICVQVPDAAADAATGKRNLLVRLGEAQAASLTFGALAVLAIAVTIANVAGAPRAYLALESLALVPLARLLRPLEALRTSRPIVASSLAERGVVYFTSVATLGVLAYAVAASGRAHY